MEQQPNSRPHPVAAVVCTVKRFRLGLAGECLVQPIVVLLAWASCRKGMCCIAVLCRVNQGASEGP
eukprot:3295234-Amphidinium_carterae.1